MKTALLAVSLVCGACLLAAGPAAGQERVDRSAPPQIGPPPALDLPAIQKRTLSNGLRVWVVESHEVPLVQVNLVLLSGSGDDPSGKYGVASLTAAMLDEGAGSRTALEIADAIDFLGATLATTSSFDASAVRLNVPVQGLAAALPIMADVALRPTFPEADLDRVRQERLTALLQARDDPAQVAPIAFAKVLYGSTHRYGTAAVGTEQTLRAFTTQDLGAFHAAMYQPSNAALVVAGDVTANAVVPQLEQHFANWRDTAPVRHVELAQAPQPARGETVVVDIPKSEQSQIRIGWVGVPRSTPEYFTLQILNTVLGGSFTSRLNQNLREEHGYTYGASSRFDMRLAAGPFQAGAGVQTDKTAEALREFFNELEAIGTPIPADEIAKARNYVALGFPSEFETSGDLAGHIEELLVYGLPEDYFEAYVGRIQAVTAEAVQKAAATHIQPRRFIVVIVGDRQAIEQPVRAAQPGPVRILSVAEVFGE